MNKIKFFLLFTVLLGGALYFGGEIPYFLFYIIVLLIILPLIHSIISLIGLRGSIVHPANQTYRDEPIHLVFQINNSSPFPIPYLTINNSQVPSIEKEGKSILSLPGKGGYKYTMTVIPKRRGYFDIGEVELSVQDIFKLFKFKKKFTTKNPILVYPKINQLTSFIGESGQYQGKFKTINEMLEDRSQINTLREYVEGDQLSSIHWKLSAKREEPVVKVYDYNINPSVLIFMDNSIQSLEKDREFRLEDKLVDTVLSMIHYYLEKHTPFTLFYQNSEGYLETQSKDVRVMDEFLNILAKIEANGVTALEQVLQRQNEKIKEGYTVVVVTARLSKKVAINILDLLNKNVWPIVILVEDQEHEHMGIDEETFKKLIDNNLPFYRMNYSTNVKNILEGSHE